MPQVIQYANVVDKHGFFLEWSSSRSNSDTTRSSLPNAYTHESKYPFIFFPFSSSLHFLSSFRIPLSPLGLWPSTTLWFLYTRKKARSSKRSEQETMRFLTKSNSTVISTSSNAAWVKGYWCWKWAFLYMCSICGVISLENNDIWNR